VAADSGINGSDTAIQHYSYRSLSDGSLKTGLEEYSYQWFYTNLDPSGLPQDSLAIIQNAFDHYAAHLLPSNDMAMHNFKIYLVLRDSRPEYTGILGRGINYYEAKAYFRYTERYSKNPHGIP
jgi:hypothetical protein